jgi:hypothetical protein
MIDAPMGLPPHFFGASRSIQNRLRMLPNFFSRSASASYCRMKTPHTTQLSIPFHMLQATSAANATNESGGEAEVAGGVGMERGAATRSLRSARGAAHRVAPLFAYGAPAALLALRQIHERTLRHLEPANFLNTASLNEGVNPLRTRANINEIRAFVKADND